MFLFTHKRVKPDAVSFINSQAFSTCRCSVSVPATDIRSVNLPLSLVCVRNNFPVALSCFINVSLMRLWFSRSLIPSGFNLKQTTLSVTGARISKPGCSVTCFSNHRAMPICSRIFSCNCTTQSKLVNIHLCGLNTKLSAFSMPLIIHRYSGSSRAVPAKAASTCSHVLNSSQT